MIDLKKGIIKINDNLIFSPNFSYEDFKKTPYFNGQNNVRMIYLNEYQIIEGRKYMVSLFFKKDKIYMVSLVNCDEIISEDNEKRRKKKHDNILSLEKIENGKEYSWGKIQSEFDARSNVSSINIYYKM